VHGTLRSIITIGLVGSLGLAACGDTKKSVTAAGASSTTLGGAASPRDALGADSAVRKSGTLRVGSDIEYAPIEFFKENTQEAQGVDYDIAQAIGKVLGVKVTFINDTDFAGIIGALQSGRFDIVMSAMSDTKERQGKGIDFIDYFSAGSSILVPKGNAKKINTVDDLCGQTVAVQKGTIQDTDILTAQEAKCSKAGKKLNVLRLEKDTDALQQVKTGRAVADLEDFPVAAYNAQTSGGGADFEVTGSQIGSGPYGIAVPNTQPALRDALVAALKAIIADGTYDKILAKWNVTAGALKTAALNGGS